MAKRARAPAARNPVRDASRSMVNAAWGVLASLLLAGMSFDPSHALAQCVGDCSEDLRVTIDELVLGTNLALGVASIEDCTRADRNADGSVAIDELVMSVWNALHGCAEATATISVPTETPTPTPTATAEPGPVITFFGLIEADNSLVDPTEPGPIPLYARPFGSGFVLVVETRRGRSGERPGVSTFEPGGVPALQIVASQTLGNGSAEVCDVMPPNLGGVPAVDPPSFDDLETLRTTVNDLSCRFIDGFGAREVRFCGDGCVRFDTGVLGCKTAETDGATHQFCAVVDAALAFPPGETLLTVRVLDIEGAPGSPAQMIVRVVPP